MDVAGSSQLGSVQRMREKMVNMHQSAIREVEAGRQALPEAQIQQALDQRVQDAEARAQNLQTQLVASQDACQELQQSLQTKQQSLQRTQAALQESQTRERALRKRVTTAEQSTQETREQVQVLEQRVQEAEQRAAEAERRAHEARERARAEPEEGEPSWLVRRELGDQPHRGGTWKGWLGSSESGYISWCTHCNQMPVWSTELWLLAKCFQSRDEHGISNPPPEPPPVHWSHSGGRADHSH